MALAVLQLGAASFYWLWCQWEADAGLLTFNTQISCQGCRKSLLYFSNHREALVKCEGREVSDSRGTASPLLFLKMRKTTFVLYCQRWSVNLVRVIESSSPAVRTQRANQQTNSSGADVLPEWSSRLHPSAKSSTLSPVFTAFCRDTAGLTWERERERDHSTLCDVTTGWIPELCLKHTLLVKVEWAKSARVGLCWFLVNSLTFGSDV